MDTKQLTEQQNWLLCKVFHAGIHIFVATKALSVIAPTQRYKKFLKFLDMHQFWLNIFSFMHIFCANKKKEWELPVYSGK